MRYVPAPGTDLTAESWCAGVEGAMYSVNAKEWALFLDLDGTLVDIRPSPRDVVPSAGLVKTLEHLDQAFHGAVAIVSGRTIEDVDAVLAPLKLVAAGVHGIQLRSSPLAGIVTVAKSFPAQLLQHLTDLSNQIEGIFIECKGPAVAVHYRRVPSQRRFVEHALRELVADYDQHLEISQGRMVYEIIPRHYSKGQALELLLKLPKFAGRRPVMIGDDAPDVSALTAAARLGGIGLKVAGEFFTPAEADFKNTHQVRHWLSQIPGVAG